MSQAVATKPPAAVPRRRRVVDPAHHPRVERAPSPAAPSLLQSRNVRLRLVGGLISVLGDQFYMIALPWLVLQITGNAFAVGTVLALAGVPRALLMLVGGAFTDRFSPRLVMLYSNYLRAVVVGLMAVLVLTDSVQVWMLYAMALFFGTVDAFFYPASQAILPQIVSKEQLQAGNAVLMGSTQVATFLGPVLAGAMIALLAGGHAENGSPDGLGIGLAFAVDALGFVVSAVTLAMMRIEGEATKDHGSAESNGMLRAIREGLSYVWHDSALRVFFVITAVVNVLITGPFAVGVPVLANSRFAEGAAAFGAVLSAFGGGTLVGIVLAGMLPKLPERYFAPALLAVTGIVGVGEALIGLSQTAVAACASALLIGVAAGYINIVFMTWLQRRTPGALIGRMMSLLMFASVGLGPVSMAAAGALVDANPTGLFVGAGFLLVVAIAGAWLNPSVRSMGAAMGE
jgi:MFS family permease